MSNDDPTSASGDKADATSRSDNRLFDTVSDPHRRYVLVLLRERGRPISEEDLATRVAAWERGKPPQEVTDEEQREALASLHHVHLPNLEEAGLIRRGDDGNVTPTGRSETGYPGLSDVIGNGDRVGEEDLDRLFDALSNPLRRKLLVVLNDRHEDVYPLSIEAAAEAVLEHWTSTSDGGSEREYDRIVVSLHHQHLPKLADAGIITYDRDEGSLVYEGHPALREEWI